MKKRIALISEHASPVATLGGVDGGGQNVYVGEIAKNLATIGYEVDLFTRRDRNLLPLEAEWVQGVRIIHVPAGPPDSVRKEELLPYMAEFTAFMLKYCQRETYHLIHANFWMSGLVAAEVKRAIGIPFAITFHALGRVRRLYQGDADQFPDLRFAIEDRIVAEADRIIAECTQEQEDLIRLYQADPAKIVVIPGGFDPGQFWPIGKELARITLGMSPRDRVILQLGRMVPRKGVDAVIRGFAGLIRAMQRGGSEENAQNARPECFRLLIVGGESEEPDPVITPEIGRLQAIAREAGVSDQVTFVGRRGRDVLRWYYSAADVFVTTPWYEPFGITPVEAMACGTPAIGSNVGGIKFTVRDGETGYLVPPNDPEAIASRLLHLYQNPQLLNLFRRNAIRRANELFTWQKITAAIADCYTEILSPNRCDRFDSHGAIVSQGFATVVTALQRSQRLCHSSILEVAELLSTCFTTGGKLLIAGNGGSAADAQHFAAEFVGRFKCPERRGLPALALNADTAVLTAWANDAGYENVFARQVEALGRPGDAIVAISTSGHSRNLIRAFEAARRQGLRCIALVGKDGGELHPLADVSIVIPASETQHIQEVQIVVIHLLCELVEERMKSHQLLVAAEQKHQVSLKGLNASGRSLSVQAVTTNL